MSKKNLPQHIRVPIGNAMRKAAELRGQTLAVWVQHVLIHTALDDCNEAREILEEANFASRAEREQRDRLRADRAKALSERLNAQRRPVATDKSLAKLPVKPVVSAANGNWLNCPSCPTPLNCRSRQVCTHEAKPHA